MSSGRRAKTRATEDRRSRARGIGEFNQLLDTTFETIRNHQNHGEVQSNRKLTARELQVAQLVADGMQEKHIAETLGIAYQTVRNHKQNIFAKLGIHDAVGIKHWITQGDR